VCFEPGPSKGSAGHSEAVAGPDVRVATSREGRTSTFRLILSHLTFLLWERLCGYYSIYPVLKVSYRVLGHCHATGPRDLWLPPFFTPDVTCGVSCGERPRRSGVGQRPCSHVHTLSHIHSLGPADTAEMADCCPLLCPSDLWPRVPRGPPPP
jgi:hypothetical protein